MISLDAAREIITNTYSYYESINPTMNNDEQWLLPPFDLTSGFPENCLAEIKAFYAYWDRQRGSRLMPRRQDIDPIGLKHYLAGMLLIDIEGVNDDGTGIYRYRVVGTTEVENRNHDPTGKLIQDGYFAGSLEEALRSYESARIQKCCIFETLDFITEKGTRQKEQSIILPLSENGADVSQLIVFSKRAGAPNTHRWLTR